MRTVRRTVINMGSQSRRPTRVPLLTALHKALLLSWARQHYHWTADDWKHVAWSDESRFQLYLTDARVRVLKHPARSPTLFHVHCAFRRIGTIPAEQCDTPCVENCSWKSRRVFLEPLGRHQVAKSPEMNIIEDIWNVLLHAVENRSPLPRTPKDLWTVLKDEWCELPPRYLQTLVESMPLRVAALLCVRGRPTRY
ncbi:hypothetical protein AVEN_185224-1 [Araneus ventricosus]|uniref:Transposase Tc1-like domain-containing protein n=1 Tax=Araneus ventricosus TaxID=182803 RepID=A0A4Y2RIA2_ARAVE|nr:hypothetical protein AVEN_185224-1 [Araneus ventricosus]